jgi:hypothetical protein
MSQSEQNNNSSYAAPPQEVPCLRLIEAKDLVHPRPDTDLAFAETCASLGFSSMYLEPATRTCLKAFAIEFAGYPGDAHGRLHELAQVVFPALTRGLASAAELAMRGKDDRVVAGLATEALDELLPAIVALHLRMRAATAEIDAEVSR